VAPDATVWESIVDHAPNLPPPSTVGLTIPPDATPGVNNDSIFSEPRTSVSKLLITFSGDINAATASPANVILAGRDSAGNPLNLAGTVIGASATASNKMEITFTPALPDFAKYRVAIDGVQAACGVAEVTSGVERIFTALRGDASNDRRVTATDVSGVRNLVGTNPINPGNGTHVRSDANDDGRITSTDVAGVRGLVGRDARTIVDP
jgi:hypothetical protein